ncbi:hypothetical protein KQX54_004896 [Cotesia glomerata]|uniref:Uncharacterized protein n=1 Tax=Cotesia glomerata TaxID=32391 RepID=A0AAV7IB78_COTGL|nr:hypothetical protein KQX54_004896 [Cotesia glomerata]
MYVPKSKLVSQQIRSVETIYQQILIQRSLSCEHWVSRDFRRLRREKGEGSTVAAGVSYSYLCPPLGPRDSPVNIKEEGMRNGSSWKISGELQPNEGTEIYVKMLHGLTTPDEWRTRVDPRILLCSSSGLGSSAAECRRSSFALMDLLQVLSATVALLFTPLSRCPARGFIVLRDTNSFKTVQESRMEFCFK